MPACGCPGRGARVRRPRGAQSAGFLPTRLAARPPARPAPAELRLRINPQALCKKLDPHPQLAGSLGRPQAPPRPRPRAAQARPSARPAPSPPPPAPPGQILTRLPSRGPGVCGPGLRRLTSAGLGWRGPGLSRSRPGPGPWDAGGQGAGAGEPVRDCGRRSAAPSGRARSVVLPVCGAPGPGGTPRDGASHRRGPPARLRPRVGSPAHAPPGACVLPALSKWEAPEGE